jgi:hypothetical protein
VELLFPEDVLLVLGGRIRLLELAPSRVCEQPAPFGIAASVPASSARRIAGDRRSPRVQTVGSREEGCSSLRNSSRAA